MEFYLPDQVDKQYRAFVVNADTPRAAMLQAKRNTLKAHPGATHMETTMQYKISDEKAEEIVERIRNNMWEGWFEDEENGEMI